MHPVQQVGRARGFLGDAKFTRCHGSEKLALGCRDYGTLTQGNFKHFTERFTPYNITTRSLIGHQVFPAVDMKHNDLCRLIMQLLHSPENLENGLFLNDRQKHETSWKRKGTFIFRQSLMCYHLDFHACSCDRLVRPGSDQASSSRQCQPFKSRSPRMLFKKR